MGQLRAARATGAYERRFQNLVHTDFIIIDDFELKPLRPPHDEDFHHLIAELSTEEERKEWGGAPFFKTLVKVCSFGLRLKLGSFLENRESPDWAGLVAYYRRRMGCITGDMLGAMTEINEAGLFLLASMGGQI